MSLKERLTFVLRDSFSSLPCPAHCFISANGCFLQTWQLEGWLCVTLSTSSVTLFFALDEKIKSLTRAEQVKAAARGACAPGHVTLVLGLLVLLYAEEEMAQLVPKAG